MTDDEPTIDPIKAAALYSLHRTWQFRRAEVARLRLELAKAEEAERAALAAMQMYGVEWEERR